ncbi:MAG: ComEA family DNA-binding protein [Ruminococcaceae bacterium]|nr:ComEA family DNA-binding protein [Oscillospiraceae bacterium]
MIKNKTIRMICMIFAVGAISAFGSWLLYVDMAHEGRLGTDMPEPTVTPIEARDTTPEVVFQGQMVNINTADVEELIGLPGIGYTLAERIVAYRQETPFQVIRDIKKVSGIGEATFQSLKGLICV